MKKSLIALAVLGSMVGAASAQSSVTLFGIVDANVRYTKGGGQTLKTMGTDGIASSRLGFRGVEDLGGGLKASFWLEHRLQPDTGTLTSTRFWHGRSSVSLSGDFGEVRLGRFLTASWNGFADFDPFGTNGVGDVGKMYSTLGSNADTKTRDDNMVGYFLPGNLGGFYGEVNIAAGEGNDGQTGKPAGKYAAGRLGYAQGPINVSAAFGTTDTFAGNYRSQSLGGSYDLGVVKLLGTVSQTKFNARKQSIYTIAATAPIGSGTFKVSYTDANSNKAAEAILGDNKQFAVGYVYDVSKRTALYSTASRVTKKGAGSVLVSGSPATTRNNGGVEVGIRHAF